MNSNSELKVILRSKVIKWWKKKTIEFGGFCLSYVEGGIKSSRPPILFLHGWNVSTEPYGDCLNCLAQRYWIIAPDLPGFGKSNCSNRLSSYQDYADCIIQLIEKLNITRFELIGHSFGGGVALAIAITIPHQVSNLIIINSTGVPLISIPQLLRRRFAELPRQLLQLRLMPFLRILRAVLHNLIFHRKHLIQGAQIAQKEDIRPWLNKISCPCLVLWGKRDYFTPLELGYALVKAIPRCQWQIVSGGYHEWSMMQPVKLAIIAFNFFDPIKSAIQINHE